MKIQVRPQYGSFVSIPGAFTSTDEGLRRAIKFEFQTEFREKSDDPLNLHEVFFTDRFLVDLNAVELGAINPDKIIKDCDFVKNIATNHPEELREIVGALKKADIKKGEKIIKEIGFTEEDSIRSSGGLIGLAILLVAVVALSGCAHCNAKRPASDPKAGPK